MARPTQDIVLWAAQDVNLPAIDGPNKSLPISDLINKGWDMNQKPAADEFNYLLNNYSKWLIYLDEKSGGASPETPEVDSIPSTVPLRGTGGWGAFKGVKGSSADNSNNFYFFDTYNTKTAISASIDGNIVSKFVYNGLLEPGDGLSGLASNTAGIHYGNVIGNVAGNADTATIANKWKTARTITFNGDVNGFMLLDGASNVGCNLTVSSKSSIKIITGSISNGGTIPLPSGYTESQCKWIVSPQKWYDNAGDGGYDEWSITGRVVSGNGDIATFYYMCIGVK